MSKIPRSPTPQSITGAYIFIMLLVFPLFTGVSGYADLTRSKYLFFVCASVLWLLALLCTALRAIAGGYRPKLKKPRPVQLCVLAFMLTACLSAALSPYGGAVLIGAGRYDGLVTTLLCGAIFLGVSAFGRLSSAHVAAFGVSVSICCAVAILQLLDINALWLFHSGLSYYDANTLYSGEFLGTIGNTNLLSAFLCLAIPFFVSRFILAGDSGSRPRRAALLVPAALAAIVLAASRVAGGVFAVAVAALVCAPVVIPEAPRLKRYKNLRRTLCLICCAAVLIALAAAWLYPGDSGTLFELSRVMRGDIRDSFGSARIQIWRGVLALVPEHPILGGGPGTLALRLDIIFSRYVEETAQTLQTTVDNAHNDYLGYLADLGLLGLGAYLAAGCLSLIRFLRREPGAELTLACAVLCYWLQSLFGLGLFIVSPLMWLLWGLFENGAHTKLSDTKDESA